MEGRSRLPMAHQPRTGIQATFTPDGHFPGSIFWAAIHAVAGFIQQVAEFFAPLALMAGILWKIAPAAANMLAEKVRTVSSKSDLNLGNLDDVVPGHFTVAGFTMSASSLVFDGLFLMAIAAVASTATTYAGRRM